MLEEVIEGWLQRGTSRQPSSRPPRPLAFGCEMADRRLEQECFEHDEEGDDEDGRQMKFNSYRSAGQFRRPLQPVEGFSGVVYRHCG